MSTAPSGFLKLFRNKSFHFTAISALLLAVVMTALTNSKLVSANLLYNSYHNYVDVEFNDADNDDFYESVTLTCDSSNYSAGCQALLFDSGLGDWDIQFDCTGQEGLCSNTETIPANIGTATNAVFAAFFADGFAEGLLVNFQTGVITPVYVDDGTCSGTVDTDGICYESPTSDPDLVGMPIDECPEVDGSGYELNGCVPVVIDDTTVLTSDNGNFNAAFEDSDGDGFIDAVIFTCNFSNSEGGCPNNNLYEPTFTYVLNGQEPDNVQYCLPLYNNSDPTTCAFSLPTGLLTGSLQYFDNLVLQDSITIDGSYLILNADNCPNQKGFDGGCDLTPPTLGIVPDDPDGDGYFEGLTATCTDDVACIEIDGFFLNSTSTTITAENILGDFDCAPDPGETEITCSAPAPAGTEMVILLAFDSAFNQSVGDTEVDYLGSPLSVAAVDYNEDECPGEDGTGYDANGCAPPVITVTELDNENAGAGDGFVDALQFTCDDYSGCADFRAFMVQSDVPSPVFTPYESFPDSPCPSTGSCTITIHLNNSTSLEDTFKVENLTFWANATDGTGLSSQSELQHFNYSQLDWCQAEEGTLTGCNAFAVTPNHVYAGIFADYSFTDEDGDGLVDTFNVDSTAFDVATVDIQVTLEDESTSTYACSTASCQVNIENFDLSSGSPISTIFVINHLIGGDSAEELLPPFYTYNLDKCPTLAGNPDDGCPLPLVSIAEGGTTDEDGDGFTEGGATITCTATYYDCASVRYSVNYGSESAPIECIATAPNSCSVDIPESGDILAYATDSEGYDSASAFLHVTGAGNDNCPGQFGLTGGCDLTPPVVNATELDADGDGFTDSISVSCTDDALGQEESGVATIGYEIDDEIGNHVLDETFNCSDVDCTNITVEIPAGWLSYEGELECTDNAGNQGEAVAIGYPDQCPGTPGPFQGCGFQDAIHVDINANDAGNVGLCSDGSKTCKEGLENVEVKIFDTKDQDFQDAYGTDPGQWVNAVIFKSPAEVGVVGSCLTDTLGDCKIAEAAASDYLVIARYKDDTLGIVGYSTARKNSGEFINSANEVIVDGITGYEVSKDIQFIVHSKKDGSTKIIPAQESGNSDALQIVAPSQPVWNDTTQSDVYLFFLLSNTDQTPDVCAVAGTEYNLVGYYDEFGNFVEDTSCSQDLTAGEVRIFGFELAVVTPA